MSVHVKLKIPLVLSVVCVRFSSLRGCQRREHNVSGTQPVCLGQYSTLYPPCDPSMTVVIFYMAVRLILHGSITLPLSGDPFLMKVILVGSSGFFLGSSPVSRLDNVQDILSGL